MKNKIDNFFKNKFIKNFIYLFSGNFLASFIGVFNTGLLIKAIGLPNNGIIFLGLSYANFFNTLFNFQSYEAVVKYLPKYMSKNNLKGKNIIKQALFLDITTAILAFIIANLFISFTGKYLKWDYVTINTVKILTFTILFNVTGCFTGILRIFEKFKYMSIVSLMTSIINLTFLSIGIQFRFKFEYYIFINLILIFFTFILTIFFTYKTLKENEMHRLNFLNIKFEKEFIKFTIYTNLSSTLDLPIFQLTPFIINKYLGFSDIAVYKILEKIGELIKRVTSIMGQAIMPEISKRLSSNDTEGAKKIGVKLGKIILLIGVLGLAFIYLTKQYWLYFLIPNYDNYLTSLYLYIILIIFTQTFIAQHPLFIYSGYVRENTILILFINLGYIFLLLYLAKYYGLNGIIISRIIQAIFVFSSKGIVFKLKKRKFVNINLENKKLGEVKNEKIFWNRWNKRRS